MERKRGKERVEKGASFFLSILRGERKKKGGACKDFLLRWCEGRGEGGSEARGDAFSSLI